MEKSQEYSTGCPRGAVDGNGWEKWSPRQLPGYLRARQDDGRRRTRITAPARPGLYRARDTISVAQCTPRVYYPYPGRAHPWRRPLENAKLIEIFIHHALPPG